MCLPPIGGGSTRNQSKTGEGMRFKFDRRARGGSNAEHGAHGLQRDRAGDMKQDRIGDTQDRTVAKKPRLTKAGRILILAFTVPALAVGGLFTSQAMQHPTLTVHSISTGIYQPAPGQPFTRTLDPAALMSIEGVTLAEAWAKIADAQGYPGNATVDWSPAGDQSSGNGSRGPRRAHRQDLYGQLAVDTGLLTLA